MPGGVLAFIDIIFLGSPADVDR